jgi:excisionase family DNA binding protein
MGLAMALNGHEWNPIHRGSSAEEFIEFTPFFSGIGFAVFLRRAVEHRTEKQMSRPRSSPRKKGGKPMLQARAEQQNRVLMTVKDVATYLSVTERTIYRLVKDNRLPAFKVGGQWRFKADILDAWISRDRPYEFAGAQSAN